MKAERSTVASLRTMSSSAVSLARNGPDVNDLRTDEVLTRDKPSRVN